MQRLGTIILLLLKIQGFPGWKKVRSATPFVAKSSMEFSKIGLTMR